MTVNRFYTADLHYDHERVIKLSKRPFVDLEEMQNTLINNWNAVVTSGDIIYVLGDICFSVHTFIDLMSKLNGQIHIIRGNHDDEAIKKAMNGYKLKNVVYHRDVLRIKDNGRDVVLCHHPIYEWDGWFINSIHLHGHCHQNIGRSFRPRAFDVGVDACNFTPIKLDKILKRSEIVTCCECMHYAVCKYRDKIKRQECIYLK